MHNNDLKYILIFLSGKNLIIKLIDKANKKYLKKNIPFSKLKILYCELKIFIVNTKRNIVITNLLFFKKNKKSFFELIIKYRQMIIIIAKLANRLPIIKNIGVSISDNKAKFSMLKFFLSNI
tara:strand:+ start:460 stop:825 length:366 start_codon:yes stop_codon:yes gene_type:complete